MIYRRLSDTGDYVFGKGAGNFLANSPETVGQAIKTALQLVQGEWFLDTQAGVPYTSKIFGTGTKLLYDAQLQSAILGTIGVSRILSYSSTIDAKTRKATVTCTVATIYGVASFQLNQKPLGYDSPQLDTTFLLDTSVLM